VSSAIAPVDKPRPHTWHSVLIRSLFFKHCWHPGPRCVSRFFASACVQCSQVCSLGSSSTGHKDELQFTA